MKNLETQTTMTRLEKLAFKKTTPFCYSCYSTAPTGRCEKCHSDDLMRELAGEGVEYGVDWVIQSLLRENLTPVDADECFEESIRQCYPETTTVGWLELDTVTVLKDSDPVSWNIAKSEWIDNELSDEVLFSFDNGSTLYASYDVESYLDEMEREIEAAG